MDDSDAVTEAALSGLGVKVREQHCVEITCSKLKLPLTGQTDLMPICSFAQKKQSLQCK